MPTTDLPGHETGGEATSDSRSRDKNVEIRLDDEALSVPESVTPNQILSIGGLDAASHYLVQVQGRHQVSYKDRGDELIHVHKNETFISLSTGPTPTS